MAFHREKIVTAHMRHKCDECGKGIGIGATYYNVAAAVNGSFLVYRLHLGCHQP